MKGKTILKKIVGVATGVVMLGATVTGAMATGLDNYPSPMFIKDGKFNGLMVIGADANTQDMLGAMDIISSLQAVAVTGVQEQEATIQTIGDTYKIGKSSNVLNIGEGIHEIKSKIDDGELPLILKDGTVKTSGGKNYDYSQEIEFSENLILQHFKDKNYNDNKPTIGIPIDRNNKILTYTIKFTKDLPVDKVEDRKIEMFGMAYDIVGASATTLEIMQGSFTTILEEGEIKVYTINGKEYEVKVVGIYDNKNEVKFKVNDEITNSMTAGGIYETKDGLTIGVREVLPNEAGEDSSDIVEFYMGAKKIKLEDGRELEIDNEVVENMEISIISNKNAIDEISITWSAEDDLFITSENDIVMPGLESIKLYMDDYNAGIDEETKFYADGDDTLKLRARLREYEVDLVLMTDINGTGSFEVLGEDVDRQLVTNTCNGNFTIDMDTDEYFLVSSKSGNDAETHVLEVVDIDYEDGVTVKDYDNNYVAENEKDDFDVGDMTINIESFDEDNNEVTMRVANDKCENGKLYTDSGLSISIPTSVSATYTFNVQEEDSNGNVEKGVTFTVESDFSGDKVHVDFGTGDLTGDGLVEDGNEDVGYIKSDVGTKIVVDEDNEYVTVVYPNEETYSNVYIGGIASKVTTTAGTESIISTKIEVGVAVLDTSISDYTSQNLIVVGGPAINRATASLMGKTYPTYGADSGITENSGMLKLIEHANGNVAIIVAGWEAVDTQRASRVLAESASYNLEGNEMIISGTSLTDITVNVPVLPEVDNTTG